MLSKVWDFFLEKQIRVMLFCTFLVADLFVEIGECLGAETLGSRAGAITKEFDNFKNLALWVSLVLGIVFFIMGIVKLTKRGGGEDGPGKAILFMIAGALLAGLSTIIAITSTSLFGNEGKAMQDLSIKP